jgi:hypothetical protein
MPGDPWVWYLLGGAIIIAAAIAVYRTRLGNPDAGDVRILDPGWQFCSRPSELDPPGAVFRIDPQRRRYPVDTLKVKTDVGREAFGKHRESVEANMGIVARFLGLQGPELKVGAQKSEQLVFELLEAAHEQVSDVDLDGVLQPFLKTLPYRADNRYYVIRAARTAKGITHHFTRNQVGDLGGEAKLAEQASLKGTVFHSSRSGEYVLEQSFPVPLRVMFLPEEIRPMAAALGGAHPELGRVPVTQPLAWEEG